MNEGNSFQSIKNIEKLKEWIYPMFFSTKGGPNRIQIIKILFDKPKKIQTIANETKMSYYHTRYHIHTLEKNGFLIKKNNTYMVSQKFIENYQILDNITNQKLLIGDV